MDDLPPEPPALRRPIPDSRDEDIEALGALCERLEAFGSDVTVEILDGYLTCLAAARTPPTLEAIGERVFDGALGRAFGEPEALEAGIAPLRTRWQVLREQLDGPALFDDEDVLRLSPLMVSWDDEARAEARAEMVEDKVPEDEMQEAEETFVSGHAWALGFAQALHDFPDVWPKTDETPLGEDAMPRLARVLLLQAPRAHQAELARELYDDEADELDDDDRVDLALFAVQELRILALEDAAQTTTRRVEAEPGRNDPCPCGSGRKWKKCHGAPGAGPLPKAASS